MHTPLSLTSALVAAAAAHAVSAHFILTSPPNRGFDELIESQAPCGGFNTTSATRATIGPKTNISLTIADANSSVVVNFGTGENPAAFSVPIGKGSWVARGNFSVPIDLTAANITTAIKGTIQVVLTGGDGVLYQCADVDFNPSATSGTTTGGSTGSSPSVSGTPAATGMPAKAGGSNAAVSTRTVANSALMLLPVLLPLFF